MQIVENLHLCPLGVTKSLGGGGGAPLLWGLGTGVGASLWQFHKWGSKRGNVWSWVISWLTIAPKYGRTLLRSFCPFRLYHITWTAGINPGAMARVFADLITNQPTNPSSLSNRPQRAAVPLVRPFFPLEALFIKSPEHKEETEWTVCASYELSTSELLEFLSPLVAGRHLLLESLNRLFQFVCYKTTLRVTFVFCLILVYTWLFMQWRFERGLVFILRKQFGDNHEKKLNHSWSILITRTF